MKQTLLIANLILSAALLATAQKTPESMLGAALHQEEVQGDLKGAIAAYQKVVATPGVSRKTAAEALVRMGQCYEKLGDSESRKAYERVVREYADQKEAVTLARARLGKSLGAVRQTSTLVWSGPKVDSDGGVSPDGRYLSYTDWDSGDLALHEIATGVDRRLTDTKQKKGQVNVFADGSAISRDGKQIAYTWYENHKAELRLANLIGDPNPRRLYDNPDVDSFDVNDWSPDGKWVAVEVSRKDRTRQIGLVSVHDGSLRPLKSLDWRGVRRIFFSPDGKYLSYDLPESDTSQERDVFVMAIDGTREIPAIVHRGQDIVMGWSPDGKRLLFASDRTGSMDLWALPIADGKPQGAPELIKEAIGRAQSMGLTRSGALYYVTTTGAGQPSAVHVASFDFDAAKLISPPIEVTHDYRESNKAIRWSPDGKYLAHVSQRIGPGPARSRRGNTLVIRSADTYHLLRELRVNLSYFYGLRWLPDGRSVLVQGADLKGRVGIFQIDTQTGDVSSRRLDQPEGPFLRLFSLSPDGKTIYVSQGLRDGKGFNLIQYDLASGAEKELMRRPLLLAAETISPDGRYVAVLSVDPSNRSSIKLLLPTAGGEPREVMRVPEGSQLIAASWAPDSRSFFTFRNFNDAQHSGEIWRVPIDGGVPVKIEGLRLFDTHPDGRRIVYTVSDTLPRKQEVWVLENFLPTASASR